MSQNDVEMEEAGKHDHDSGNNVEESLSKVLDSKTEIEGENPPSEVRVVGDANTSENGVSNEANSNATVKSEIEDQSNHASEANDRINIEEIMGEQTNTNSNNDERSSTKPELEEQTDAISLVDKHTVSENEVVEQNTTNGVVKEDKSAENGVEGGNPVKNVIEENPIGDGAAEMPESIGREDGGCVEHVPRKELTNGNAESVSDHRENRNSQTELSLDTALQSRNAAITEVPMGGDVEMEVASKESEDKTVNNEAKELGKEIILASPVSDENAKNVETATKQGGHDSSLLNQPEAATPSSLFIHNPAKIRDRSGETSKTVFTALPQMAEGDDGTPEDQAAFMKELETFHRERAIDFKPPKFYGQPLNCLKLWRAVIRLGGYDRVTGSKLWRQVGESFHPPKTCTTVSWTFRIFYEKSLRDYEVHKIQSGDLQLPVPMLPEASGADCEENGYQGAGSGRARRDAAARAMQGWHVQRLFGGEAGDPVIKDKNLNNTAKREKNVKSIGSLKQKRPNEVENSVKYARAESSKQLVPSVVDVGPPADWVKINVRQTEDCFEVYALVPGLLREEVRVQSDPAGRLVITGQPEQVENPWGVTPFKKVVSLPLRIDPLKTSAVVSLHGRLFVRVPFELSNA
ncbi:hypothetical protein ABFS83_03G003500 [Erythranthe nasuta]